MNPRTSVSSWKSGVILPLIVALVLVLGGLATQAQTATQGTDGWHCDLDIYAWGAGLSGDVGPGIKQYHAHVTFSDILKNLKFAAMFHFDARKDKWGVMVDPIYVKLGKTVDSPRGLPIDVNLQQFIVGVAGFYRLYQTPESSFDLTFGGRYNELKTDLTPRGFPTYNKSFTWIDPVVGFKGGVKLSKVWSFGYRADVGGFDVGSRLTWSGVVRFDAQLSKSVSLGIGYIALHNDYEKDQDRRKFIYDMTMSGPYLGVSFKW